MFRFSCFGLYCGLRLLTHSSCMSKRITIDDDTYKLLGSLKYLTLCALRYCLSEFATRPLTRDT